jgi:membrane protein required for beta-lactamase induction
MDPDKPSLLRRVLAIVVLLVVAAVALRLVVGFVSGLITALLWVVVLAVLVGGALWARSTLKSGKRQRAVKPQEAPAAELAGSHEDRVAAEMRRIEQQLREQGRR